MLESAPRYQTRTAVAKVYPLAAIVGQEELKLALMLNAVNPAVGGVLIRGEKGTAKSTAVRALADLLPEIEVVAGCPFGCDPHRPERLCSACRQRSGPLETARRRIKVVDLPLNATEDRVAGGIDFSLAIVRGRRALAPGLLAEANRGILYVDEVNLLDDHIVDIILDAAAEGENIVEREGISFRHPASFILVGTMNPEEGELRPQLLDRFGLCVSVEGCKDAAQRVELMLRREHFDRDPEAFCRRFEDQSRVLAKQIEEARRRLPAILVPGHLRGFIARLAAENNVAGHRADLIMEQAARAMAALKGCSQVNLEHITTVAPLVLAHRRQQVQPPPPPPPHKPQEPENRQDGEKQRQESEHDLEQRHSRPDKPKPRPRAGQAEKQEPGRPEGDPDREAPPRQSSRADNDQLFQVGATFKVKPITTARDRLLRRGSGRRSRSRVLLKQGRYVASRPGNRRGDIALDATIRAAAPYQKQREGDNSLAIKLTREDIREKIRERRMGNFLLFAVDASGSMGARGRMAASKGAIMSLLLDAYQKRDRVAMISFRRDQAQVNLPPTTSVELAGRLLAEMPVGGRTPLAAGLAKTFEQVRNVLLKDPTARPIVILITDGKANVALGTEKPLPESLKLAAALAREKRAKYIVVDTEEKGLVTFGLARRLATAMEAAYFKIDDLKARELVNIVKGLQT